MWCFNDGNYRVWGILDGDGVEVIFVILPGDCSDLKRFDWYGMIIVLQVRWWKLKCEHCGENRNMRRKSGNLYCVSITPRYGVENAHCVVR